MQSGSSVIARAPRPSSLADVLDLILDKGLVIDAYVRVSLVGIELLTIDARVVVASVDTYLRFAEAVNRLDLVPKEERGLPELLGDLRGDGKEQGKEQGNGNRSSGEGDRGRERQSSGRETSRSGGRRQQGELPRSSRSTGNGERGGRGEDGEQQDDSGGLIDRIAERARR